jgi:hypothetical protein
MAPNKASNPKPMGDLLPIQTERDELSMSHRSVLAGRQLTDLSIRVVS